MMLLYNSIYITSLPTSTTQTFMLQLVTIVPHKQNSQHLTSTVKSETLSCFGFKGTKNTHEKQGTDDLLKMTQDGEGGKSSEFY